MSAVPFQAPGYHSVTPALVLRDAAGATEVRPVADQFYGDRCGTVQDPCGYQWTLATHIEEVSIEEAQRRMEALFAPAPSS